MTMFSVKCSVEPSTMRPGELRDQFAERAGWFDRHYYDDSVRGRVRLRVLREQLRRGLPAPPAKLLDAGCGPGRMATALAAEGHRLTLLDPSEAMLERARVAMGPHAGGSRVLRGTVEKGPAVFGGEAFDAVLLHAVVCYVEDLDAALGAAAAVRKPLVDLGAVERLGWGVALWLGCDDAQALHDSLVEAGVPVAQEPFDDPFGRTFAFVDPDGYRVTVHDG